MFWFNSISMYVDALDVMINAPVIDEREIRAVVKVLESGILTSAARLGVLPSAI